MERTHQRTVAHGKGKLPHYADGGLIKSVRGLVASFTTDRKPQDAPIGTGAASQAKAALATRKQTLDEAERKAVGMAKGGEVKGPGTGTSDDVPIMASSGEFMVKAAAVRKLGVAFMNKLNSIADGDAPKAAGVRKAAKPVEKKTGVAHMDTGGGVDEARRRVAPYVNHRAPSGAPVMQEQLRLPNNAPAPGTAVATRPGPNFTMGGAPQQPPPAVDPVTDVRAKGPAPRLGYTPAAATPPGTAVANTPYRPNFTMGGSPPPQQPPPATDVRAKFNPANASPEYKAFQAERAANPGPKPATPSAPKPSAAARAGDAVKSAGSKVADAGRSVAGNRVLGAVARLATPALLGASGGQTFATPTEAYETRFGLDPSTTENPALRAVRDVGVRALGAASDLGNVMTGGLAGQFYRDKQAEAQTLTPPDPAPQAAPSAVPAPAAPVATAAQPPNPNGATLPDLGAVRQVGNNTVNAQRQANGNLSFSGENVGGAVQYAGADKAGFKPSGAGVTVMPAANFMSVSPSMDQRLSEARNAAAARGDWDAVKASYAAQGQDFGPKVDPIAALVNNGKPMTVRKAAAIAQLQQQALAQQNSQADRKLAQDKFSLEKDGAKLDNAGKQRLDTLQTMILDPNAKPEDRKAAIATYRALTGKTENQNRYTVVPGGQRIDQDTGQVYTVPSQVIDNQSGQFVEQQGAKAPAQDFKPGQVYTDGQGRKAKWDGQAFVPVK